MAFWCHPGRTSPARLVLARRRRMGEGSTAGMPWGTEDWARRWPNRRVHAQPYAPPRHGTHRTHETPCAGVSLGDPITCGLASTGRRNGGWVCSELQMAEDFANHRALRDDGDEPQCPALAQWTRAHL